MTKLMDKVRMLTWKRKCNWMPGAKHVHKYINTTQTQEIFVFRRAIVYHSYTQCHMRAYLSIGCALWSISCSTSSTRILVLASKNLSRSTATTTFGNFHDIKKYTFQWPSDPSQQSHRIWRGRDFQIRRVHFNLQSSNYFTSFWCAGFFPTN